MLVRLAFLVLISAVSLPLRAQSPGGETDENYGSAVRNSMDTSGQKAVGTRYFLSTNVVNTVFLAGNLALEVRFPSDFAFKVSVFGSPFALAYRSWDLRTKIIGIHPEARWYVNRSKTFYAGISGNLLRIVDYNRRYNFDTREYEDGWSESCNTVIVSVGGMVGYYLRLGYRFGLDFNAGFGMNYLSTGFTVPFITQYGVSLSWEVSKNPPPRKR